MRAVEDDHVDRPGVEAQQCVQLTGTNRSIGLIALINQCPRSQGDRALHSFSEGGQTKHDIKRPVQHSLRNPICPSPAWWLLQGGQTRSHPELGRQTPSRQWYYVSRPGRVGRCQACQGQIECLFTTNKTKGRSRHKTARPFVL